MNTKYWLDRLFIHQPRFRRFVTSLLEPDRDQTVTVAGTELLVNRRREHGYLRASRLIRKNGTLRDEIPVLMNLFAVLRDGDTFVDVGANVGLYTHSMARLARLKKIHIVALEPHPDTFARLSARPVEGVAFVNLAASDQAQTLTFVDGAVSHVFTTADKANKYSIASEVFQVRTQRLDSMRFPTDSLVVKIDVEGQESRVLHGAAGLFDRAQVRAVYLDGYEDASIHEFLLERGFTLYEGRTLAPVTRKVFSLLAIRRDA
jgi:FkbM family methyltransferase